MSAIVGIDLGTTHSLIAHMTEAGPKLIPNALGDVLTPSVVGIDDDGNLLVGRAARELMVTRPNSCAATFKRHMGTEWTCRLAGKKYNAIELSSLVLRSLKDDAEAHLGGPVERAVITVPAYFNEHQRTDTIRAGTIAGFRVERIINEPTAAALAYGWNEPPRERIVLIFDLGGGTFDVSIVDQLGDVLEIRSSAGEIFLGGEDFTNALAGRVLESRGLVFEQIEMKEPLRLSRLRGECERAKRQLSREDRAEIRVPDARGGYESAGEPVVVTREEFEKWTRSLLDRCELPLRRALGDAGLKRQQIDEVILVGGATRMPATVQQIESIFGRPPRITLNPDEVVALGAAVQAALTNDDRGVADMVVTDVAPFTLGIETTRQLAGEHHGGYFLPIIQRNSTIPVSRIQIVQTVHPNQQVVNVRIFQGENRKVEQNLFLGEFEVTGIPRGPAGQPVSVRFTYDLNGVLEVEAEVLETKQKFQHVIVRYARGMTQQQIDLAIREMQHLKRHPRDEAVNQFLLKRAERLIAEVAWFDRSELESLLNGFEEALELQDAETMARFREALEALMRRYEEGGDEWSETEGEHDW